MKKIIALTLACLLAAGMFSGCKQEDKPYVPTGAGLTWDEDLARSRRRKNPPRC